MSRKALQVFLRSWIIRAVMMLLLSYSRFGFAIEAPPFEIPRASGAYVLSFLGSPEFAFVNSQPFLREIAGNESLRGSFDKLKEGARVLNESKSTEDERRGAVLVKEASDMGNSYAELYFADLLRYGRGVARDPDRASQIEQKLAESGFESAKLRLGENYANGRDVERSYEKAIKLYEEAAASGSVHAHFLIGVTYVSQPSDRVYLEKAAYHFEIAARQGHVAAQWGLFCVLESSDEEKALYWLFQAAYNGHSPAQDEIGPTILSHDEGTPSFYVLGFNWVNYAASYRMKFSSRKLNEILHRNIYEVKADKVELLTSPEVGAPSLLTLDKATTLYVVSKQVPDWRLVLLEDKKTLGWIGDFAIDR